MTVEDLVIDGLAQELAESNAQYQTAVQGVLTFRLLWLETLRLLQLAEADRSTVRERLRQVMGIQSWDPNAETDRGD